MILNYFPAKWQSQKNYLTLMTIKVGEKRKTRPVVDSLTPCFLSIQWVQRARKRVFTDTLCSQHPMGPKSPGKGISKFLFYTRCQILGVFTFSCFSTRTHRELFIPPSTLSDLRFDLCEFLRITVTCPKLPFNCPQTNMQTISLRKLSNYLKSMPV